MLAALMKIDGARLQQSITELAQIGGFTDERTGLQGVNRLALTDADRDGRLLVKRWFEEAGLQVRVDRIGNVYGRRAGTDDNLDSVLSGSHIDSVPTGGAFDGVLGVLGALEVVRSLNDQNIKTRRPIEIAYFTDEEGARFGTDMLGSAVAAGRLTLEDAWALTDADGKTVKAELERIGFWVRPANDLRPPTPTLRFTSSKVLSWRRPVSISASSPGCRRFRGSSSRSWVKPLTPVPLQWHCARMQGWPWRGSTWNCIAW